MRKRSRPLIYLGLSPTTPIKIRINFGLILYALVLRGGAMILNLVFLDLLRSLLQDALLGNLLPLLSGDTLVGGSSDDTVTIALLHHE